jgi:cytochrome d ubiquinol oxidase subunit I
VPALKEFPPEDRPNSTIVFWSFRVMVGLGFLMIFTGLWSLWLRKRDTLYTSRPFLYLALWMGPSGLIAILAGWFTTEIGRQPWVVYGLMRTADASSNHSFMQMSITLVMFVVVYFALFGAGLGYMMRLVRKGPKISEGAETPDGGPGKQRTPARPLSAADDSADADHDDTPSLTKEI